MTQAQVHKLYYAALRADKAFEKALRRSGDNRYGSLKSAVARRARARKVKADEKYLAASRALRSNPKLGAKFRPAKIKARNGRTYAGKVRRNPKTGKLQVAVSPAAAKALARYAGAKRVNPKAGEYKRTFYDVVDLTSKHAISRSHGLKSEAMKMLRRIRTDDKRVHASRRLGIKKRVETFYPGWVDDYNKGRRK